MKSIEERTKQNLPKKLKGKKYLLLVVVIEGFKCKKGVLLHGSAWHGNQLCVRKNIYYYY